MSAARVIVLFVLLALASAPPAAAAPGDLDPSFDEDGKAVVDLAPEYVIPEVMAVQPDGRIVVAGHARGLGRLALFRLLPGGSLDPSFASGGATIVNIPSGFDLNHLASVDLQGDKVIVIGSTWLARFLPDGQLDTTFADDGFASSGFPEESPGFPDEVSFADAEVLPDGRIAAVGGVFDRDAAVLALARYLPDGSPDSAFSGDGRLVSDLGRESARGIAIESDPDGRLVVAAEAQTGFGESLLPIARFLSDGELDPSFAGDGIAESPGLAGTSLTDLALTPDGRIVAAGLRPEPGRVWRDFAVVRRLLSNGAADLSFSGDGTAMLDFGFNVVAAPVGPGGEVIMAGAVGPGFADLPDVVVGRLTAEGTRDPSFGRGGLVSTDFGWFTALADAVQMSDGRLLVLTEASGRNANRTITLARYLVEPGPADADADGVLDQRDRCDALWAPECPRVTRVVRLHVEDGTLQGDLGGSARGCTDHARLLLRRQRPGPDRRMARLRADFGGDFSIDRHLPDGRYYVVAPAFDSSTGGICKRARSRNVDL